jgi:hypothetical protein
MFGPALEQEWHNLEGLRNSLPPFAIVGIFKDSMRKVAFSLAGMADSALPALAEEELHYATQAIRARDQKKWGICF